MAENGAPVPICVLKVMRLDCCSKCPVKVKQKLQEINGVRSVEMDTKAGLVKVSGFADTGMIQKAITKIGKKSEILTNEKEPLDGKGKLAQALKNKQKGQDKNDCRQNRKAIPCKGNEQSCACSSDSSDDETGNIKPGKHNLQVPTGYGETKSVPLSNNDMGSKAPAGFGWPGQRGVGPGDYGGYHGMPPGYAIPYNVARPYAMPFVAAPPPPLFRYPPPFHGMPPPFLPPLTPASAQVLPPLTPLPPSAPPRPPKPLSNLYAVYGGQKEPPKGNALHHVFSDDNVNACSIT